MKQTKQAGAAAPSQVRLFCHGLYSHCRLPCGVPGAV